jgi:hypothetical protein
MRNSSSLAFNLPESSPPPAPRKSDSFLPFPAPPANLGVATHVRSTLIATSLQSLRTRSLLDRYTKLLQGPHKETVLTAVAGSWIAMDAAVAHYKACDALRLDTRLQLAMGMDVGDRVHGTFLGMMVRTARTAGVTPWAALAQSSKLHGRLFSGGGGISVSELGPKDARVDMVGNPLCDVDYFRTGMRGVYQAAVQLFCASAYSVELARGRAPRSTAMRISWA